VENNLKHYSEKDTSSSKGLFLKRTSFSPTPTIINSSDSMKKSTTAPMTPATGETSDEVFQLRLELNALRQRLKAMDEGGKKSELLDIIEESKEEVATKNKQIATLNEKFQQVTKAVSQMEAEHDTHVKTIASLESENKRLSRHLSIREKEITTLVTRCATQEERLSSVKDARMLEKTMNQKVDELHKQLSAKDAKISEVSQLEQIVVSKDQEIKAMKTKIEELELKNTKDSAALLNLVSTLEKQVHDLKGEKNDLQKNIEFVHQEKARESKEHEKAIEEINIEVSRGREREESLRKSLEDQIKRTTTVRAEADDEIRVKAKEITVLQNQLSQLKEDSERLLYENTSKLSREKENQVSKLEADVSCKDELISSLNRHVTALKEANDSLDKDYKSMAKQREELATQRREDNQRFESERLIFSDRLLQKDEEIKSLQQNISLLNQDLSTKSSDLDRTKSKMTSLEQELSQERNDLQGKFMDAQGIARDLQYKLSQEEETTKRLRDQLTKGKDAHEQDLIAHTAASRQLEEHLQRVKQLNLDHEKEVKQVSIALSQSKEEVSFLKREIASLVVKAETMEVQAAEVVDELEKKILTLQEESRASDEKWRTQSKSFESQLASAKTEVNLLNSTKNGLETSIRSRDTELESYRFKLESMQNQLMDQNSKITTLHLEMDAALLAYDKSKTEFTLRISALERELNDERVKASREAAVFQDDYEKLQGVAARTDELLDQKDAELKNTQSILADKSNELALSMTQITKLDRDLSEARKLITELQEESDNYIRQKEAAEAAAVKLKSDIDRMEDLHISAIQKERSLRMSIEEELTKTKVALSTARSDMKEFNDLESQCEILKDKVKRQEAFLKKKIHQEKLLKERMGVISVSTPRSPDGKKISSGASRRTSSDDHSIVSGMDESEFL